MKAAKLWSQAVAHGHAATQCNLAWCYEHGKGLERDMKKAVPLLLMALAQGHARSPVQPRMPPSASHGEGERGGVRLCCYY